MKRHFTLLSVLVLAAFRLAAQQVDTLYIYEPTMEYDTVFMHNTLWVHDSLHLQNQYITNSDEILAVNLMTKKSSIRNNLPGQRNRII